MVDVLHENLPNDNEGKTKLYFELIDERDPEHTINLFARPFKISDISEITKFLINSHIEFKINGIKYLSDNPTEVDEENEETILELESEIA